VNNTSVEYNSKQLISSIQEANWIDLTDAHKELREYLELSVKTACVDKKSTAIVMVKGAFGIGKTAALHYLFHYAWTVLKVPTFMFDLSGLIEIIKEYLAERELSKLPNKDVSRILGDFIEQQVLTLKNTEFSDINNEQLRFPSFERSNLTEYLGGFSPLKLTKSSNHEYKTEMFPVFDSTVIDEGLKSDSRSLVLIDEFESKYHELKNLIDDSGGGVLRDFLNDISTATSTNFFCVIGNGPSSGYEVSNENNQSGRAAEVRRIIVKQIHAPTVKSLKESFLSGLPDGHVNFYWWLSRSRPGQFKRLKESLPSYDVLSDCDYPEFLRNNSILDDPIDDFGESDVRFLKTSIVRDYSVEMKNIFKQLLIELCPQKISINSGIRENLIQHKSHFLFSGELVHTNEIINALQSDILGFIRNNEHYASINYDRIHLYIDLIHNSLSTGSNLMAFGAGDLRSLDVDMSGSYLSPLLMLLYDFINIFEDEKNDEIKPILDMLLDLSNRLEESGSYEFFSETTALFANNTIRLDKDDEAYIQLSIFSMRELIEQPIGSPDLSYKSKSTSDLIDEVYTIENIFVHKDGNSKIIVIPDLLDGELLASYLDTLKNHFIDNWKEGICYHSNGELITTVVYFTKSKLIKEFSGWLLHYGGDRKTLPVVLDRLRIVRFDSSPIHNSQRIGTFLNALCKIGIIGIDSGDIEISIDQHGQIDYRVLIGSILDPLWTTSKHLKRTIEYYEDLLSNGENCAFSIIHAETTNAYKDKLMQYFHSFEDIDKKSWGIKFSDTDHINPVDKSFSTNHFISHLLGETNESVFGDRLALLSDIYDLGMRLVSQNDNSVSLHETAYTLSKKLRNDVGDIRKEFISNHSFNRSVVRYVSLLAEHAEIDSFDDYLNFISNKNILVNSHFDFLNFSNNKRYFLSTLFLGSISTDLDCSEDHEEVVNKINEHKNVFSGYVEEYEIMNDDVELLFGIKDKIVDPNDFNRYSVSIIAKYLISSEADTSVVNTTIGFHLDQLLAEVSNKIEAFSSKYSRLISNAKSVKSDVEISQAYLNKIYNNGVGSPIINLIEDKYGCSIKNNYLFNRFILKPLKGRQKGELFNNIFNKTYRPSRDFDIDEQLLCTFEEGLDITLERNTEKIYELTEKALLLNNQFAATETILSYIGSICDFENPDPMVEIIEHDNIDDDPVLAKYESNYKIAVEFIHDDSKTHSKEITSDTNLEETWIRLLRRREALTSVKEFKTYKKEVFKTFEKLHERITAPEVDILINWLKANDSEPTISDSVYKSIYKTLIRNYREYQDSLDTISENISLLEFKGNIFSALIEEIVGIVLSSFKNREFDKNNEEESISDFVSGLATMLENLIDFDQLHFKDNAELVANAIGDDEANPEEINKINSTYSTAISKILNSADKLINDDFVPEVEDVYELLRTAFNDIDSAINRIVETDIHNELDDDLVYLFGLFVNQMEISSGSLDELLNDEVEKTWDSFHNSYNTLTNFYSTYKYEDIESVRNIHANHGFSIVNQVLDKYLVKLESIFSESPLKDVMTKKWSTIVIACAHVEAKIHDLDEIKSGIAFCEIILNDIKEYKNRKIPTLRKLKISSDDIDDLEKLLPKIGQFVEHIKGEDSLFKGLVEYYMYLGKEAQKLISKYSELLRSSKESTVLPFLEKIPEEGLLIDGSEMINNNDKIMKLADLDLITIKIEKKI